MVKYLRIEWMKIKNYRVFQVFSILYLVGIMAIIFIFYKIYLQLTGRITGRDSEDLFRLFSEDTIWKTVCIATSWLLYLPGMVIISLFANEVSFKTHRQNIIDGWTRETFITTKIWLIICITAVVAVMNILATMMMCGITGVNFSITAGAPYIGLCFLQTFIYLMFALLLAIWFRRSGVAIIVFFAYGLLLEWLLVWPLSSIAPGAQHFMPLQVADSLIMPEIGGILADRPDTSVLAIAAVLYASLYVYLAVRKYKYDDL